MSKFFFFADRTAPFTIYEGSELWVTEGTPETTRRVKDLFPFDDTQTSATIVHLGDGALIHTLGGAFGEQLYFSDGTSRGTQPVLAFNGQASISNLNRIGDLVVFAVSRPDADNSGRLAELWVTDGTADGTHVIASATDITGDTINTFITDTQIFGERVLFEVQDHSSGVPVTHLYAVDPDGGNLELLSGVADLLGFWHHYVVVGEGASAKVFFPATTSRHGTELWVTDGTAAGTHLVADLVPGRASAIDFIFHTPTMFGLGDKVIFTAGTAATGYELFVSDGTRAGTHVLRDTVPGTADGILLPIQADTDVTKMTAVFEDNLYYLASDRQIWRTDGTRGGTGAFFTPGLFVSNPELEVLPKLAVTFDVLDGLLLMGATSLSRDGDHQLEYNIWVSDGTVAGTTRLTTEGFHDVRFLGQIGTYNLFRGEEIDENGARNFTNGLWVTNGTAEGTFRITEYSLNPDIFLNVSPDNTGRYDFVDDPDATPMFRNIPATARGDGILWTRGGTLNALDGNDVVEGSGKRDTLNGDGGDDNLSGIGGIDLVSGGSGADLLRGGTGNDVLFGGEQRDRLFGNAGGDRIAGGAGDDQLTGGSGADIFVFRTGWAIDRITDFDPTQGDRIELDMRLLPGSGTVQERLNALGTVTADGLRFDFGNGDAVLLTGVFTASGLSGVVDLV